MGNGEKDLFKITPNQPVALDAIGRTLKLLEDPDGKEDPDWRIYAHDPRWFLPRGASRSWHGHAQNSWSLPT